MKRGETFLHWFRGVGVYKTQPNTVLGGYHISNPDVLGPFWKKRSKKKGGGGVGGDCDVLVGKAVHLHVQQINLTRIRYQIKS